MYIKSINTWLSHAFIDGKHVYFAASNSPDTAEWYIFLAISTSRKKARKFCTVGDNDKIYMEITGGGLKYLKWAFRQLQDFEEWLAKHKGGVVFISGDDDRRESAYRYVKRLGYRNCEHGLGYCKLVM